MANKKIFKVTFACGHSKYYSRDLIIKGKKMEHWYGGWSATQDKHGQWVSKDICAECKWAEVNKVTFTDDGNKVTIPDGPGAQKLVRAAMIAGMLGSMK